MFRGSRDTMEFEIYIPLLTELRVCLISGSYKHFAPNGAAGTGLRSYEKLKTFRLECAILKTPFNSLPQILLEPIPRGAVINDRLKVSHARVCVSRLGVNHVRDVRFL